MRWKARYWGTRLAYLDRGIAYVNYRVSKLVRLYSSALGWHSLEKKKYTRYPRWILYFLFFSTVAGNPKLHHSFPLTKCKFKLACDSARRGGSLLSLVFRQSSQSSSRSSYPAFSCFAVLSHTEEGIESHWIIKGDISWSDMIPYHYSGI